MDPLLFAGSLIVAYILGALPTGLVVGKLVRGVDIRKYGSGSTGSTNMYRTLGRIPAATVVGLDIAKGALAVGIAWIATDGNEYSHALAGVAVIVGHSWPVFSGFRGGRGVMTGWGAMIALSPIAAGITALGWIIVTVTRYVSVGSLFGTTLGAIAIIVLGFVGKAPMEYVVFSIIGAAVIWIRHFDNIGRLMSGAEKPVTEAGRPKRARSHES
ncbi:MAG: glycerol-3-phosphate 1-O-acyltransferase PlsY [Chloroflexi bacterium]|jgi:acyl phosphate:glycerol-3-phosphate acyltransferase|nr:glycerol-3-phosphate 1-O-acyltransferase PlsY [Chloroflexota bacterium]MBT4516111.1 glycerol-3-phosphate 1-O-acyltransferase PlsY [Chloroflexota bacterium]MBT6681961.1 glycerol-3-phosphate 1-O-acyltransferase PlsY [Chloroflexota bacterium]